MTLVFIFFMIDTHREVVVDGATDNLRSNQSINQNLYNTPSRCLLGGAPDPGQAE